MLQEVIYNLIRINVVILYGISVMFITEIMKKYLGFPNIITRKIANIWLSFTIPLCVNLFVNWYIAIIPFLLGNVILSLFTKISDFDSLYRTGPSSFEKADLKTQVTYFQIACITLITFFWGILGFQCSYVATVGSISWGLGDSAAGILGEKYGKRRYNIRIFDRCKTVEGSISMFCVSFVIILGMLTLVFSVLSSTSLIVSLFAAMTGTLIEAMSKKGTDTLTVPITVSFVSFLMLISLKIN